MKKFFGLLLIGCFLTASAQTIGAANNQDAATGYQEGLQTAHEGAANQKKWGKGEGNPEMANAYQEGLKMSAEGIKNKKVWAEKDGDSGSMPAQNSAH